MEKELLGTHFKLLAQGESSVSKQQETTTSKGCEGCNLCASENGSISLPFKEFPFLLTALAIFVLLVVKKQKGKVLFWTLGLTLFAGLVTFSVKQNSGLENNLAATTNDSTFSTSIKTDTTENSDFEFSALNDSDEFEAFEANDDGFETFDEFEAFSEPAKHTEDTSAINEQQNAIVFRTLLALLLTIFAGLAFHFANYRKLRYAILLASLVYFGFYSSGCPCMISSFQHFILFLMGEKVQWFDLLWIVGLLPITYFFGKIWCGWVCHLGALQEFIYRPQFSQKLLKPGVQKGLKILQYTSLAALVIQLFITRTNLYIKVDPFKVAFNLFSPRLSGYILLGILLVSSLLMYRPFCRGFCPVGLMLGWISKIPGASKLHVMPECKSCNQCQKVCTSDAISTQNGKIQIDNSNCIRCGECQQTCRFDAIKTSKKTNP